MLKKWRSCCGTGRTNARYLLGGIEDMALLSHSLYEDSTMHGFALTLGHALEIRAHGTDMYRAI